MMYDARGIVGWVDYGVSMVDDCRVMRVGCCLVVSDGLCTIARVQWLLIYG